MPYYVYRIHSANPLVKNLELLAEYADYKDAKNFVKEQRRQQTDDDSSTIKIIFANNQLHAEEQLQEQRAAPILREWEK